MAATLGIVAPADFDENTLNVRQVMSVVPKDYSLKIIRISGLSIQERWYYIWTKFNWYMDRVDAENEIKDLAASLSLARPEPRESQVT